MGSIIQKNISSTTSSIWDKITPNIPHIKALDNLNLNQVDTNFKNLSIGIGALVVLGSVIKASKTLIKTAVLRQKLPTKQQLQHKYGFNSWAVVADCRGNQEYCTFLAKNGFHLFLMGQEQDIKIAKDQVQLLNTGVKVQFLPVDWKNCQSDLQFYEDLLKKLGHIDIAFLVLPKIEKPRQQEPTHLQIIKPYQHFYLLVRYLGPILKWRSYRSAIIFPSYNDLTKECSTNGVSKGLLQGIDGFGRIMNFQLKQILDVVVARGSVQNAFKGLGRRRVAH